jgi:hypothetical protein
MHYYLDTAPIVYTVANDHRLNRFTGMTIEVIQP